MKKIYEVPCKNCKKTNKLWNDYVWYFRQYKLMRPKPIARLMCDCGTPINIRGIGLEKYKK